MSTEKYHQIFTHHAVPPGKHQIGNGLIFQYENDPTDEHAVNAVKHIWIEKHSLEVPGPGLGRSVFWFRL